MGLDCQLQIQVQEPGSQQGQDLQGRLDLGRPGYVGAKPIVPITHVDPCVPTAERRNPFEVRRECPDNLLGRHWLTPLARSAHGIGRSKADLEVKPHRLRAAPKAAQPLGIEPCINHRGLEKLHTVHPVSTCELQGLLGRQAAMRNRAVVEADADAHPDSPGPSLRWRREKTSMDSSSPGGGAWTAHPCCQLAPRSRLLWQMLSVRPTTVGLTATAHAQESTS